MRNEERCILSFIIVTECRNNSGKKKEANHGRNDARETGRCICCYHCIAAFSSPAEYFHFGRGRPSYHIIQSSACPVFSPCVECFYKLEFSLDFNCAVPDHTASAYSQQAAYDRTGIQ